MRMHYAKKYDLDFELIPISDNDGRARRISAYLNLVKDIVDINFKNLKSSGFNSGSELSKYFEMLPDSPLKEKYRLMLKAGEHDKPRLQQDLLGLMSTGSIDVNIMTKIDGPSLDSNRTPKPIEFNEAHAALRGFVTSKIKSSVVLSAGLNPRLFGYMSSFKEFLPNEIGEFSKRIILKVSDFRSAQVQGKMLAKKGLWVNEYRIESGLNCGGHAFATQGHLLGPIMHEFNSNMPDLKTELFSLYASAIEDKIDHIPSELDIDISVQGGVGNELEHNLLRTEYGAKSVGWGSPFLMVPEAVNIDIDTLELLEESQEEDYFLSDVSPLGVRFNTVRHTSSEVQRDSRIESGKPGSPCFKKHLAFNTEFGDKPLCTASNSYQKKKIAELKTTIEDDGMLASAVKKVTEKICLCVGLANASLKNYKLEMYKGMEGVVVCPGPNLAYFSNSVSLQDMVDHIYGRTSVLNQRNRPNMFLKELKMYVDYFEEKWEEQKSEISQKQIQYLEAFRSNLNSGIDYYSQLISEVSNSIVEKEKCFRADLDALQLALNSTKLSLNHLT